MAHKVPSAFIKNEWQSPAATATTLLATLTGRLAMLMTPLPLLVPLPNWPKLL